jgi:hypothetical protein
MSTQLDMVMDTDALEETGPFNSRMNSNILQEGPYAPIRDTARYDVTEAGKAPHGGITYIDQAVGGVVGPREDVAVSGGVGVFSYRSRTQPFNGDFLAARVIVGQRDQGYVGQQSARGTQRAAMPNMTNLPDRGDVVSGFTNPALARLLSVMRGDR